MKKVILASAIAMSLVSGASLAASGDLQFIGSVTDTTCDISPEINGVAKNVVQLGTAPINGTAPEVQLSLKAKDSAAAGCQALTNTGTATVDWASAAMNPQGLGIQSGAATGSYVKLKSVNAKTLATISQSASSADFTANLVTGVGYQFTAELNAGATPGDFQTTAAYTVSYK